MSSLTFSILQQASGTSFEWCFCTRTFPWVKSTLRCVPPCAASLHLWLAGVRRCGIHTLYVCMLAAISMHILCICLEKQHLLHEDRIACESLRIWGTIICLATPKVGLECRRALGAKQSSQEVHTASSSGPSSSRPSQNDLEAQMLPVSAAAEAQRTASGPPSPNQSVLANMHQVLYTMAHYFA